MRVAIFDPSTSGHHLNWLHQMGHAIADVGIRPILWLNKGGESMTGWAEQITPLNDRCDVRPVLDGGLSEDQPASLNRVAALLAEERIDHLILPYADAIVPVMGLRARHWRRAFGDTELEVAWISFKAGFREPTLKRRLRRQVVSWAMRRAPISRVHFLDPTSMIAARAAGPRFEARARVLPEPVEPLPMLTRAEARSALGWPDRPIALVTGAISMRKRVDLLFAAIQTMPEGRRPVVALFGKHSPDFVEWYAKQALTTEVIARDRYLSDDELNTAIIAADVAVLPYPGQVGSSGVLVRAATAGTLVVGQGEHWIGWALRTFCVGEPADLENATDFGRALGRALDAAPTYTPTLQAQRFTAFHTQANFRAHITDRLRDRTGLARSEDMMPWSDVGATP